MWLKFNPVAICKRQSTADGNQDRRLSIYGGNTVREFAQVTMPHGFVAARDAGNDMCRRCGWKSGVDQSIGDQCAVLPAI